jgi:hypothetical protein
VQRFLILVVILAVAAGVYLLLDRSDPVEEPTDGNGNEAPPPPDDGDAGLMTAPRGGPPPEPKVMQLKTPAALLMVAGARDVWTATLELTFDGIKDLEYATWYLRDVQNPDRTEGVAGAERGLSPLTARPTAEWLETERIRVLVLDQVDPHALSSSFWEAVAERVRSGRLGLYVRPGFPVNEVGMAQSVHPVLTHDTLKELLPVLESTPIEGPKLAGSFKTKQDLVVTAEGTRHPATRLVEDDEKASLDLWRLAGQGKGSWGTTFCYPVQSVRPGARVLANVEAATSIPALIVSGGPARVLWQGNIDFGGRQTHFTPEKDKVRKILLTHFWVWLAGQSE